MKTIFTFISLFFISLLSYAQVSQVWESRYSNSGGTDNPYSMALGDSNNVYVTGSSVSGGAGTEDYATVKYNTNGVKQWVKRYNGSGGGVDIARAIAADYYGNSYVTGSSAVVSGATDIVTIKYDLNGDTLWTARYNGIANKNDIGYAIAVDDSENVYVTGSSEGTIGVHGIFEDYITIKYDSAGTLKWAKPYNGPGTDFDVAYSICVDYLGNVIVTGESGGGSVSSSDSHQDYATIKYSPTGGIVWTKRYNGTIASSDDKANRVAVDTSGNIYVTGKSEGTSSYHDFLTVKYSASGKELWTKRFNGSGNSNDDAKSIALDDSSNCYVTGSVYNGSTAGLDIETIKYDSTGKEVWAKAFNITPNRSLFL